ncbi:hypothetical protein STEG23_033659 [Scotinomys teguina]
MEKTRCRSYRCKKAQPIVDIAIPGKVGLGCVGKVCEQAIETLSRKTKTKKEKKKRAPLSASGKQADLMKLFGYDSVNSCTESKSSEREKYSISLEQWPPTCGSQLLRVAYQILKRFSTCGSRYTSDTLHIRYLHYDS